MTDTRYQKAKSLLYEEYAQNREIVKESPFHLAWVNEKLRHSLQVSGAGNGILRHEAVFCNRSTEYTDLVRAAIVLHDIFRFREVSRLFLSGAKSDHGVEGAALLTQYPDFNDIRITLPVKHHGHMIEAFYEDAEYRNITDSSLSEDVKHIIFAVRDADKIANWQILTKEFEDMRLVWLPHSDDFSADQGRISETMMPYFRSFRLAPRENIRTNADQILNVVSWLFDINYAYSLTYARRLGLLEGLQGLFEILQTPSAERQLIRDNVDRYLAEHFPE